MKNTQEKPTTPESTVFSYEATDDEWVEALDAKIEKSKSFWDKDYKLEEVSKKNEEMYLGPDPYSDDEKLSSDNRIFSSVRTIVPYVTSRITEPQVSPSSKAQAAKRFAEDFEKALFYHVKDEELGQKIKFALEDAVIRRRGYLKPRYDAATNNFCAIEYVPAESIIVDHLSKPYEEPKYFRHVLEKSASDLLTMFPDNKVRIMEVLALDENSKQTDYDKTHKVHEDWCFVTNDEGLDLVVTWSYKKKCLGKMQDPNWRYGKTNILKSHMMPLIPLNVLNDGRKRIDRTSFVEQAAALQNNVNERSDQISLNAGLGNTGMPVVDSSVLADDQAQYLAFEEDTVLELEVPEGKNLGDVFDIWRAGTMPIFVYEDKLDSRNAIDNIFGTPNVFRGEQSDNNTLGQDVLVRDQAFGRQQEIVDAIDSAMKRLYPLVAQFLLVYGDEEVMFDFVGEDGEFDYVIINTTRLDTFAKIRIKAGTSMPIDRPQRRSTADHAAQNAMIDPLSYWEIMDEGNAEKYAKRLMDYTQDPASFMQDVKDEVFNRDAFVDIEIIKNGGVPPFREDLPKDYFDHLNNYIISGDLDNPTLDPMIRDQITQFIDIQLARGQKMLGVMETQLPTPEEVSAANETTDNLNAQDQAAADLAAKQDAKKPAPAPVK
jgi:hypothetical protein